MTIPEEQPVRLKNGAEMPLARAVSQVNSLRSTLEHDPQGEAVIRALFLVASGKNHEVSEEIKQNLRDGLELRPDGTLHPDLEAVILSSYRETPEGTTLVDPFPVESEKKANTRDQIAETHDRRSLDALRDLLDEEKGRGSDPSP